MRQPFGAPRMMVCLNVGKQWADRTHLSDKVRAFIHLVLYFRGPDASGREHTGRVRVVVAGVDEIDWTEA